jgi:hypothetical protein
MERAMNPQLQLLLLPLLLPHHRRPAGYVQPSYTQYFSGALSDNLILLCHRKPNRWIYDTGCTSHSSVSGIISILL